MTDAAFIHDSSSGSTAGNPDHTELGMISLERAHLASGVLSSVRCGHQEASPRPGAHQVHRQDLVRSGSDEP